MKIFPAIDCFDTRRTSLARKPGLKIESPPTPICFAKRIHRHDAVDGDELGIIYEY
jgi:hypothetical protein